MATFLEGVESIGIACTLVMLVPAAALVLVSRRARLTVAVYYAVGAALLTWARAAGYWRVELRGAVLGVAAALAVGAFVAGHLSRGPDSLAATGAGLVAGALAGWGWLPCVGPRLGDILNRASADGLDSIAGAGSGALMLVYMTGALLPALMLALTPHALPASARAFDSRAAAAAGGAAGAAYALTLAVGRYDDLVGELYRIATRA